MQFMLEKHHNIQYFSILLLHAEHTEQYFEYFYTLLLNGTIDSKLMLISGNVFANVEKKFENVCLIF